MRGIPAVVVAGAVLVASCGGGAVDPAETGTVPPTTSSTSTTATPSTTPTTEPEAVGGLVATIATNRLFVTRHAFGLGLRNVGTEPVEVATIFLESGLYGPAEVAEEGVLLQPGGRRFVLPIPYGEPICDGAVDRHVAVVTLTDGRVLRVPAPEEFDGGIARIHERECFGVAVRERADLRFGDEWAQDGVAIHGELLLEERAPGEPLVVEGVRGNVIFTMTTEAGEEGPVLAIDEETTSASVAVTLSADRCDPHAVAEFKRPYHVLAWVSMGGSEAVAIEVEATGPARDALDQLIASCSTG